MLALQNRWKLVGNRLVYYGIRRMPFTNINNIKVKKKDAIFILSLISNSQTTAYKTDLHINSSKEYSKGITRLIKQGIIVDAALVKTTPRSLDNATFCTKCIANDFIIPGLEFDDDGLCPMCASEKHNKKLISILPVKKDVGIAKKSRFDVAVFYTGGKDSHYLLYYYATVQKKRVLALTWEIPFMSHNARQSMENAKKQFPNVEFVSRTMSSSDLNMIYKKLFALQNNTCACPSLAYMLFYPILCAERVPFLVLGNEPVQIKQLLYNSLAPALAYRFHGMKSVHFILNIGRILLLKKPLKSGQREMLFLIKQLAYGDSLFKKMSGYKNELISNICIALDQAPHLKHVLRKAIKASDRKATMPALIHLDFNSLAADGKYDWSKVKATLVGKCGWIPPSDDGKNLHTSCAVEAAKDYSQFIRFYNMESTMIPFSALELSLASAAGNIDRDSALSEIKNSHSFSFDAPKEHLIMRQYGARVESEIFAEEEKIHSCKKD